MGIAILILMHFAILHIKDFYIMESLQNPPTGIRVDPVTMSWACFALGDLECGYSKLEEAVRQRSSSMIFLRTAPIFDPVRDEPRFQAIVDKMNFPS